jgi:hypothetical protein
MAYGKKKSKKQEKEDSSKQALVEKWRSRIKSYEKAAETFIKEGKDAWAEYLASGPEEFADECSYGDRAYSHVSKYVQSSYYSRTPLVVGSGDFDRSDPDGTTAAYLAERLGRRFTKACWFGESVEGARDDYVHTSRGITRVYVDTEWVTVPVRQEVIQVEIPLPPDFMPEIDETGQPIMPEPQYQYFLKDGAEVTPDIIKEDEEGLYIEEEKQEIKSACPYLSHVAFKDYFHTPSAKNRRMLTWEGYRLQMSVEDVKSRWPKQYDDIAEIKDTDKKEKTKDHIDIFECWDKNNETVVYLYLGGEGVVLDKELPDPYELAGFFPSVGPIVSSKLTDKLWGVSDFTSYKDKLDYLKGLDKRRKHLSTLLRRTGIGDGKHKDNLILLNESTREGDIVFVDNYTDLVSDSEKSSGLVKFFDVAQYVEAFKECNESYFSTKQEYYEYFGLERLLAAQDSGDTTADEAQLTASLGLLYTARHRKFQEFVLENVTRLIDLAIHTLPENVFKQLVGYDFLSENHKANFPKAYEILQSDFNRAIRVDIDLDSTIASTKESEAQANMQLFQTVTQSLGPLTDIAQTKPEFVGPLAKIVSTAIGKMQGGSGINDELGGAFDALVEMASTPPEQPPEDPNIALKQQKLEIDAFLAEHKVNIETREQEFKEIIEQQKLMLEQYQTKLDMQEKFAEEQRLAMSHQMNMQPKLLELEKKMAEIEVAKIQMAQAVISKQPEPQAPPAPAPEPKQDNTAAILAAVGSMMQGIPQSIVNVQAPQPTRRVGRIEKNGDTATIVVEEEAEDDDE